MKTFGQMFDAARGTEAYEINGHILAITEAWLKHMERNGITRSRLARKLKVSAPYITKLFRGQNLTITTMVRVSRALGLTLWMNVGLSPMANAGEKGKNHVK